MEEEKKHMSFKDKKYIIIRSAISKELTDFVYSYFCMKRKVTRYLFDTNYFSPYRSEFGTWTDAQIPNTYSHYADIAMETLLEKLLPLMKKETELNLIPTYSYARIYKKGDVLKRHKDRFSCDISTTLNLGGDPWSVYLEPNKNVGVPGENGFTATSDNLGIKVELNSGDMLVYSGCILEHWREPFEGENCAQVFLHYNNADTQGDKWKYDQRPFLGLPADVKNENK